MPGFAAEGRWPRGCNEPRRRPDVDGSPSPPAVARAFSILSCCAPRPPGVRSRAVAGSESYGGRRVGARAMAVSHGAGGDGGSRTSIGTWGPSWRTFGVQRADVGVPARDHVVGDHGSVGEGLLGGCTRSKSPGGRAQVHGDRGAAPAAPSTEGSYVVHQTIAQYVPPRRRGDLLASMSTTRRFPGAPGDRPGG